MWGKAEGYGFAQPGEEIFSTQLGKTLSNLMKLEVGPALKSSSDEATSEVPSNLNYSLAICLQQMSGLLTS